MQKKNGDLEGVLKRIASIDQSAANFLSSILDIAATWDDLIDRDVPVSDTDINTAFELAVITLPRNQFYIANFNLLNPLVISAIINWRVANNIERKRATEMYGISFIIRSSYADLFAMVGFILGDIKMAVGIGKGVRQVVHDEGFDVYVLSVEEERLKREARR